MNGQIELLKVNLMGFTAEDQAYFVSNVGGKGSENTRKFLEAHKQFFQKTLHCGQIYFGLRAPRIAKFKAYCQAKGFEVIDNGKKV